MGGRSSEGSKGFNSASSSSSSSISRGTYKEFDNVERSSFFYEGDGKEQIEWFNKYSNYNELIDNMNETEKDAFNKWAYGYFTNGQQYRGWDTLEDDDKQRTQIYDDYLDKATLSHGIVVSRGSDAKLILGPDNERATFEQLKAAEGSIITSKGNMSFAAAKHGLAVGDPTKQIEYKLHIPGGTTGAGMWIGDTRINDVYGAKQLEFMTNRDISVRVGKTVYDAERDKYIVHLEYLGRRKHDYGKSGRLRRK